MLDQNAGYAQRVDCTSLLPNYFVEGNFLSWEDENHTELSEKVMVLLDQFRTTPESITFEQVKDAIRAPGSQIGRPEGYETHLWNAGGIYADLVQRLNERNHRLDLPSPEEARIIGWLHDFTKIYVDYPKMGQQVGELEFYWQARHLGIPEISHEVAMHHSYLEIANLLAEGVEFPKAEAYASMKDFLNHSENGESNLQKLNAEFKEFVQAKDNLPLMVLTVVDPLARDDVLDESSARLTSTSFTEDYEYRMKDVLDRYFTNRVIFEKPSSLLGLAYAKHGGIERMAKYRGVILALLEGSDEEVDVLKERAPALWK